MKKTVSFFGLLLFFFIKMNAQQRIVAECTINYARIADDSTTQKQAAASSKIVYIKGNDSRIDIISPSFSQTIFYDKNSGNAVVLREFGANKVMTKLSKTQWIEKNKKFEGAVVNLLSDTKNILGYECKKATIQAADGNLITVFYATAIVTSVREFEYQFKDVPGLVLEYETEEAGKKIKYSASKINLSPVQTAKFDVPTNGYRILN